MTDDFRGLVPALTGIDVTVAPGTRHIALPSDLFAITVYCNDDFDCFEAGEERSPHVLVTALRTKPGRFVSGGHGELALAFLTPEALTRTLRAPLEGVVDRRIPLDGLCGVAEQRQLRDRLMSTASGAERIERFGQWIESRLTGPGGTAAGQRRVARATNLMMHTAQDRDLERLAAELGVTWRQLERDFHLWLGTSPSHYARLVRFQRAAAAIAHGVPIVDAAVDHGYADQAHLTRSTRMLAEVTPAALQRETRRTGRQLVRAAMAERLLIAGAEDVVFGVPDSPASSSRHADRALSSLSARTAAAEAPVS